MNLLSYKVDTDRKGLRIHWVSSYHAEALVMLKRPALSFDPAAAILLSQGNGSAQSCVKMSVPSTRPGFYSARWPSLLTSPHFYQIPSKVDL